MKQDHFTSQELLSYYENEAEEVPIFGSLREISLAENIIRGLPKPFHNLIDIGCGEGYLLYRIQEKYPEKLLYGLDISNGRIATTKNYVPTSRLLRGDVLSLPFPDKSFDIVVCSELLEHMVEYKKVVDELIRISKRTIIITVPNELKLLSLMCPKCQTKHYLDGHVNFFTQQKLMDIFSKRQDVSIKKVYKFHSIFTYNKLSLKFPLFLRLAIDRHFLKLHRYIGFLKPNFLLISLEKRR
jgi:ubiquinone/menaquinone biosynthesis C-methylase UbiE